MGHFKPGRPGTLRARTLHKASPRWYTEIRTETRPNPVDRRLIVEERQPPVNPESPPHLHDRPKKYLEEWLDFPAHVHHTSYRMANPPLDRPRSREGFLRLLDRLNVPENSRSVAEKFGYGVRIKPNGDRLVLAWEAHTEYYSHQVWHIPDDKTKVIEFGAADFSNIDVPTEQSGTPVSALDIVFSGEKSLSPDLVRDSMPGPHVYGSRVFGGEISIATTFTPDEAARERYLVWSDSTEALVRHLARVIDAIVTIENYYHLILLPFPAFTKAVDRIHELEQNHLRHRSQISTEVGSSESRRLEEWLNRLTQDFVDVSRFAESMRYRLSASVPYNAIIHATLKGLQESPVPPFLPVSDYILSGISGVSDGYQQLIRRIDAIEADFQSLISVIRARANLLLESQNLKLLTSMDKTTKSQAILQHTVEGLSVIVIAYYLSGLAGYVFKAMEERGWLESAALASGIFVPVSLLISLTLIFIGRRLIVKRMSSDKK
jgi:uncharacterized membrane-anchored protein